MAVFPWQQPVSKARKPRPNKMSGEIAFESANVLRLAFSDCICLPRAAPGRLLRRSAGHSQYRFPLKEKHFPPPPPPAGAAGAAGARALDA
jgi:hypothetical protein